MFVAYITNLMTILIFLELIFDFRSSLIVLSQKSDFWTTLSHCSKFSENQKKKKKKKKQDFPQNPKNHCLDPFFHFLFYFSYSQEKSGKKLALV